MIAESFEKEMLECLRSARIRYPEMQTQDIVKFIFQGMLGVGHLLASRESVTAYLCREMSGLEPNAAEALTEKLSPAWCWPLRTACI